MSIQFNSPIGFPNTEALAVPGTSGPTLQSAAGINIDGQSAVQAVHVGGTSTASVGAAGASPSGKLKTTPGRVSKALVTTAGGGSVPLIIYDNVAGTATGTVIGYIPAAATVGTVYILDMPAMLGISIPAQTGAPTITLGYS